MIVPRFEPMLAVPWPAAFTEPGWIFEPKWDGIRGIITWDGGVLSIRTRRGTEVADRYPEVAIPLDRPCVLDGEIVALADGRPSFQRLQNRTGPLTVVVFDLLWLDGESLIDLPLARRTAVLSDFELPHSYLRSEPEIDGIALWNAVVERDLEGIVAKRSSSPYRPGTRSADWRKIHHVHTAKAVVGGFTAGEGGRSGTFGALVLGQWDGDGLRWVGNVGTGFDEHAVRAIRTALDQMVTAAVPFLPDPEMPSATWVDPSLVAAVEYRNWTEAGRLRFPVFRGFTDDDVASVTWAAEGP